MKTYSSTVAGRNELFADWCATLSLVPKWEPKSHPDHSKGRPSVSMGGHLMGAVAHVLCNALNVPDMESLYRSNPSLKGVTKEWLYQCGSSYRLVGEKGGHISKTVAGKLDADFVSDSAQKARDSLGLTGVAPTSIHARRLDDKATANDLNAKLAAKREEYYAKKLAAQAPVVIEVPKVVKKRSGGKKKATPTTKPVDDAGMV